MRSTFAVFMHECILFGRNRLQVWGVLFFIVVGGYSISYGHAEIARENSRRQAVADSIRQTQLAHVAALQADTLQPAGKYRYETAALPSLVRFNFHFLAARKPLPLASLALGQLDVTAPYYLLNAQSLYIQTLKGEIANPFQLKAGNFDLAFVLVYLLPLLIIALCFDVLSAEKEAGILPLLRMGRYPPGSVVLVKFAFRWLLACAVVAILSLAAFLTAPIPLLSMSAVLWMLIICVYCLLWHALLLLIVSFNRSSALNAMLSLGVWVLLVVVVPVTIQAQSKLRGASSLSLSTLMRSRNMEESSTAMQQALNQFYQYYPQLIPADSTRPAFYYFQGYSAFLYNTDREAQRQVAAWYQAIRNRAQRTERLLFISPAANTFLLLNHLAGTGLQAGLAFQQQVAAFHRQVFWFANNALFQNRYMNAADYARIPVFEPPVMQVQPGWVAGRLLQMLLLAGACVVVALYQLQEKKLTHA